MCSSGFSLKCLQLFDQISVGISSSLILFNSVCADLWKRKISTFCNINALAINYQDCVLQNFGCTLIIPQTSAFTVSIWTGAYDTLKSHARSDLVNSKMRSARTVGACCSDFRSTDSLIYSGSRLDYIVALRWLLWGFRASLSVPFKAYLMSTISLKSNGIGKICTCKKQTCSNFYTCLTNKGLFIYSLSTILVLVQILNIINI